MIRRTRIMGSLGVMSAVAITISACGKADAPLPASTPVAGATTAATPTVRRLSGGRQWAPCSIIYRLERSGLAPSVDSSAKPTEKELGGEPLMVKIGLSAELELHVYPDSAARIAAAANARPIAVRERYRGANDPA